MKAIDFENHCYAPDFFEACSKRTEVPYYDAESQVITWIDDGKNVVTCPQGPLIPRLVGVTETRMLEMDEYGIGVGVLSSAPGVESMSGEEGVSIARSFNDYIAQKIDESNGRYLGTACLPVYDVEESVRELERCVKDLGFVGWHTHSNFGKNGYLDDERYRPILKKAAELGAYVYLHPTVPMMDRYYRYGYSFCGAGLGFTVDAATTITALICSGAFDECENLHVLMGHLGEALPFVLERMDWGLGSPRAVLCRQTRKITDYFKENIWVTTSGNTEREAFELVKQVLGIDRILIGSDYPFGGDIAGGIGNMMTYLEGVELTDEERRALYYENGEKLIGRRLLS